MKRKGKRLIAWLQAAAVAVTVCCGMPVRASAAETEEAETLIRIENAGEEQLWDREINFNEDWRFFLEEGTSIYAAGKDFDDSGWRQLDLPHDYSIEQDFDPNSPSGANGGFLNGGVGWYRKTFTLPKSMAGKRISIQFGGVYMDSTTYVNGVLAGNYPYGYSPFAYDITDYVAADGVTENVIAVRVNHQQPSSRWYSGSGIYRNVKLVVTDDVHVARYGTYVTTPGLEQLYAQNKAEVSVETNIENDGEQPVSASVTSTVYDSEGAVFAKAVSTGEQEIAAGETAVYEQTIPTGKPNLWSLDTPNLYKLVSEVKVDGSVVDTYETTFGFRWITMDSNEGFHLNGEYMKLHGMCMHHDQGALGAVANYRAIERQMEIMKSMGVNAIRVTHNPAADELLEICNKMGLLVIDEAFDCWESAKRSKDYARFFTKAATHPDARQGETWAEFDIKNMVNRGKNEPCIIMWSVGNEIIDPTVATAKKLVSWIQEVDSTRPATQGFNNFIGEFSDQNIKQIANEMGVVGFNYGEASYDAAHAEYPDWILMGSETSSAVRSRGYYIIDHDKKIRSCYDDGDTVGWGRSAEDAWKWDRDRKFVIGEFVWTGFDYIGEPSPYHEEYPAKSSYFGAVDTAGIPKDAYYIYQSQWTSVEDHPMVHLLPHWNWEADDSIKDGEGRIKVQAYSNAASVELFLNGKSLGEQCFEQKKTSDGRSYQEASNGHIYLEWLVKYAPGELRAVAKDTRGKILAEDVICTAGEAAKVELTPDRDVITADGRDLSYILVEIKDKDGNLAPTASNNVRFTITGNGNIVGVDNGDAAEVTQSYKGSERKAYNGKAMVIVQSASDGGSFTLTAEADGLASDTVKVYTTETPEEEVVLGYQKLADLLVEQGMEPQFPETVMVTYSNGKKEALSVAWDGISEEELNQPGIHKVSGMIEKLRAQVEVNVIVRGYIGIRPVHLVTTKGALPCLPETVTAVYNTGETEELPVTWEQVSEEQTAETGIFTVKGMTQVLEAEARVRVTEEIKELDIDVAPRTGTYPIPTASWVQENGNDPVSAINDGKVVYRGGEQGDRWIAWEHWQTDEWVCLEFEHPVTTGKAGLDFWNNSEDNSMDLPDSITISYSMDGKIWKTVTNQTNSRRAEFKTDEENIFTFDTIEAKYIRWNFYNQATKAAGVSEVHVYETEILPDAGSSAALADIRLDGTALEGFSPEQCLYTIDLEYGAAVPRITVQAEDENASVFVAPPMSANGTALVQVVSEDGKEQKTYEIRFREQTPILGKAEIRLAKDSLMEGDLTAVQLTASLQDGTVLSNGVLDIMYEVGDPELAEMRNGQLYALRAGSTTLKASIAYQGVTLESNLLNFTVLENPDAKTVTAYEQIAVSTAKGQAPKLPQKIRATFTGGMSRQLAVIWDDIAPEQYGAYGTFTVTGSVEGQTLRPEARVTVKGITGVQQFSCATPVGAVPKLAEKARVYYSDGTEDELEITWEKHPKRLFLTDGSIVTVKGTVTDAKGDGSVHKTAASVRVTADTVNGDKFTGYKNGFYWPLGIASYTNTLGESRDSASELNDNIVSRESADNNRWCNWQPGDARGEDWAGIVFGLEEVTYKDINNLDIDFYTDHGASLPAEYVIEYYRGDYFNIPPSDPDCVGDDHPAGKDSNWKEVSNLAAPKQLSETETCHFSFDMVETCAIRIRMKAQSGKCLAITEMGAYEKLPVSKSEPSITGIMLNKIPVEGFDPKQTAYNCKVYGSELPVITAESDENASVSVVYPGNLPGTAQVIVRAEDGVRTKTYNIQLESGQTALQEALQKAEEAQKKADEAQKAAEEAQKEAEEAQKRAQDAGKEAESLKKAAEEAGKAAAAAKEEAEKAKQEAEKAKQEAEAAKEEAARAKVKASIGTASLKTVKSSRKRQIKVSWGRLKKVDGYEISYSLNSKFKKAVKKTAGSKKTGITLKKLKSGKTCYVRIRGYKKYKGEKLYGPYSAVKKVKVK